MSVPCVKEIEEARSRIVDHVRVTPILNKESLAERYGGPVLLKGEHLQRTGSFKLRGALNLISQLSDDEKRTGVVAASAGNHAQGVAVAASICNAPARIWMPRNASLSKIQATRSYGAEVVLEEETLSDALEAARAWADEHGSRFVHPFDDVDIINGQGTIALEVCEQVADFSTVVIPIGGGGLFAGIAAAIKELKPECRIIGVQSEQARGVEAALEAGQGGFEPGNTIADGIAVKQPGVHNLHIIEKTLDQLVHVSDDEIGRTLVWLLERGKQIVEGAGAVSLAAVMSGKVERTPGESTVCILSGGNIDPTVLMPVIRLGLAAAGRYMRIETMLPDRPGELSRLLSLLAKMRINVLSVEHHREGLGIPFGDTRVELTLQTRDRDHMREVVHELAEGGYRVLSPASGR